MRSIVARISLGALVLLAIGGIVVSYGALNAADVFPAPQYFVDTSTSPEIDVSSFLVFDVETGQILFEENKDSVFPIASVTKLVTAAVFLEDNDLDATVSIEWSDLITEGEAGKLGYGEEYTYRELMFPLLLESSNDAAATFRRVDGNLIERMNEYAVALGFFNTSFADASGLSDKNVSTAQELKQLVSHIRATHPYVFDMTIVREFYSEDNGWINNSPFIDDDSYKGGKHGFTYEANRTAVALFDDEINGGSIRTLGYVLLGSGDLDKDMSLLREYTWKNATYR